MKHYYQIASHHLCFIGELCHIVEQIPGFAPFRMETYNKCDELKFALEQDDIVPEFKQIQYTLEYEDVVGTFGLVKDRIYKLSLKPEGKNPLYLWADTEEKKAFLSGNMETYLLRFALWVGFGVLTSMDNTVAIHSSCIVHQGKAVLFLGESGTGKSTHTRLWREHIEGAMLLNDDSPIIHIEDGKVWIYGSPWSGKTPCYKNQRYELTACVRLSQAPHNKIERLSVLHAYSALHPSCPPEFAYDGWLYDGVSQVMDAVLSQVPVYHLECLPNKEAAMLSYKTLFG